MRSILSETNASIESTEIDADLNKSSKWFPQVPLHYLLLGALLFILISVVIDMAKEIHELKLTREDVIEGLVGFRLFSMDTLSGFLRELGFACAIAWAIAISIERVARERDMRHVAEARTLIAQDVFRAVIGSFVPKDIRDVTFDTILLEPITRSRMRLDITIIEIPDKYHDLYGKFFKVQYLFDYEVDNESSSPSTYNVDLYIDKCPHPKLAAEHQIETVAIGEDQVLGPAEIETAKILQETDGELRYRWVRTIPARGRLRGIMRWSGVEGIYDSVVWTTLLPTIAFELRLEIAVPALTWGIDPLHPGELRSIEPRRDIGLNQYRATKPLLPYQGLQVWWRPAEAVAIEPAASVFTAAP